MRVEFRRLTDREWQKIHAASGAPPEMRGKIEARASSYLMHTRSTPSKPHEVKSLLEVLSRTAEDLLHAYKAVMRNRAARISLKACIRPQGTLRDANQLLQDIADAANRSVQEHQSGHPGVQANLALYWLVSGLARIWETYSGKPFSRASRQRPNAREFVIATCKIIDPSLADATIDRVAGLIVAKRRKKKSRIDPRKAG